MRVVSRRVFAILTAFAVILASLVPVTAQSSDSVDITGAIVSAPLSIEISNTTVAFGALDYRATAQPNQASATGFLAPANNGAYWVANTALSISIISPSSWSATACVSTSNGLPGAGLYNLETMPGDAPAANVAFAQSNVNINACASATPWTTNNNAGTPTLTRYLGTWVQSTDTPRSFTAIVHFSVSN